MRIVRFVTGFGVKAWTRWDKGKMGCDLDNKWASWILRSYNNIGGDHGGFVLSDLMRVCARLLSICEMVVSCICIIYQFAQ